MKIVVCACGARATVGGDCIKCGEPLGSIAAAFTAAFVATIALTLLWVGFFWLTGIMVIWFAALFGGLVSGAVAHHSFGRGWAYQAIASGATLVGLSFGDTLILLLMNDRLALVAGGVDGWAQALELFMRYVEQDALIVVFAVLGLFGGFWLWKQPEAE